MVEALINLWNTISENAILAGVMTAVIIAVPPFILKLLVYARMAGKDFLLGKYFGYHPLDAGGIVKWEINIEKTKRGHLKIRAQEMNEAAYTYEGDLLIRENFFYANLQGTTHDTNAFLVLATPFNRSEAMPGSSGILSGVTPKREVTAVKYLINRTPMAEEKVSEFFSQGTASRIKASDPPFTELMKAKDRE